jgi:hypothetical protein
MKRVMMVMAIVAALSFLVSLIAVAPLFAVKAPQTTPTTKQAPAQETPGSAANVKPASKPPVVKKEALLVRGTVTTNYGKGAGGYRDNAHPALAGHHRPYRGYWNAY